MIAKSPAFQFYPKDWLSDGNVRAMGHEARGIYIDLLAIYWNDGGLPADPQSLARRVCVPFRTFQRLWPRIEPCFRTDGNSITSLRLEAEKVKQAAYRTMQQEKGLKSAKSRVSNKTNQPRLDSVAVRLEPEVNSPSPSPSASPNDRDKPCVSETRTHAREGMLLDEIPCPACQRAGHLSQSPGRKGNPPGFWCHRDRGGCGQNYPLDYAEIVDRMTPGARRAILAQAAIAAPAAPSGQGRRRAPSWDQPDAFEGDLSARADAWIAAQWPSGIVRSREELLDLLGTLSPPDEIRGAVHMALFARNPHLREVSA